MNKSPLILHAILQNKKYYKTKEEALNDAKKHFENQKIKGFVRETKNQYRVRVIPKTKFIKTEYISKKISPATTLVFGKLLKGGSVVASDVSKFVEESYKKPKESSDQVGDFVLDKELSTRKAKVYHDPKTNKTIVANRGTTGTVSDWTNNLRYGADLATGNLFNFYNKSDRMKQAEKVQKEAIEKYGKVDTNIGHSQSGVITRELNKKGLTGEVININPATFYDKPKKNEKVYRSTYDPVSFFSKGATTLKGSINPLKAHSTAFIKKSSRILGGSRYSDFVRKFMKDNNILKYRDAQKHPNLKDEWVPANIDDPIAHKEKIKANRLKRKSKKAQEDAYYEEVLQKNIKKKALETVERFRREGEESYNLINSINKYPNQKHKDQFKKYFKEIDPKLYLKVFEQKRKIQIREPEPIQETRADIIKRANQLYEAEMEKIKLLKN